MNDYQYGKRESFLNKAILNNTFESVSSKKLSYFYENCVIIIRFLSYYLMLVGKYDMLTIKKCFLSLFLIDFKEE